MPTGEFMRQPLPVTLAGFAANGHAVDITVPWRKTRIPLPVMSRYFAIQFRRLDFAVAETGWTNRCAIAAAETGRGNPVPGFMLQFSEQPCLDIGCR